jgi:glyoxylase-like metal-dependent hydrolase (beta-lactamase superfamily II)
MRLTDEVMLVGGGAFTGFGLSSDFDAHIYLLDGGDELALVDCGMGTELGIERVIANIERDGVDPSRIRRLLLTHFHTDHASGAARYRERLQLRVAFSALERETLETADHERTSFAAAQAAGIFPAGFTYPACPVDDALRDGDELQVGHLAISYLETPGHSAGHGSFLVRGREQSYLLGGDAVFAGGKLLLQATADCDLQASFATIRKLEGVEFHALLPGHGPLSLTAGRSHVDAAAASIRNLTVPPNL